MLVLTRKKSEVIQIGDGIIVKVIQTGPGTVKLGIQAPKDVRILRAELCDPLPGSTLAEILAHRRVLHTEPVANANEPVFDHCV